MFAPFTELDLHVELDVTVLDDDVAGVVLSWMSEYNPTPENAPTVSFATLKDDSSGTGNDGDALVPAVNESSYSNVTIGPVNSTTQQPAAAAVVVKAAAPSAKSALSVPTLYCAENTTSAVYVTAWLTSEPYAPVSVAVDVAATAGRYPWPATRRRVMAPRLVIVALSLIHI